MLPGSITIYHDYKKQVATNVISVPLNDVCRCKTRNQLFQSLPANQGYYSKSDTYGSISNLSLQRNKEKQGRKIDHAWI